MSFVFLFCVKRRPRICLIEQVLDRAEAMHDDLRPLIVLPSDLFMSKRNLCSLRAVL